MSNIFTDAVGLYTLAAIFASAVATIDVNLDMDEIYDLNAAAARNAVKGEEINPERLDDANDIAYEIRVGGRTTLLLPGVYHGPSGEDYTDTMKDYNIAVLPGYGEGYVLYVDEVEPSEHNWTYQSEPYGCISVNGWTTAENHADEVKQLLDAFMERARGEGSVHGVYELNDDGGVTFRQGSAQPSENTDGTEKRCAPKITLGS